MVSVNLSGRDWLLHYRKQFVLFSDSVLLKDALHRLFFYTPAFFGKGRSLSSLIDS